MIRAIQRRREFDLLSSSGRRLRRGPLWCTWCPDPSATTPAVAYSTSRALGSAVTRNRLRRRLRAILAELDRQQQVPSVLMMFGAAPAITELTFDQLRRLTASILDEIRTTT